MDGIYRCIETSLLALGLVLGIAATVLPQLPAAPMAGQLAITLAEISVSPND